LLYFWRRKERLFAMTEFVRSRESIGVEESV
jgi:hypothetical protein